jgi:predicted dehydrogenase
LSTYLCSVPLGRATIVFRMKKIALFILSLALPLAAQDYKIAVVGMVHSHVWGHLNDMIKGNTPAKLVAISEPKEDLVAEAKKMGADDSLFIADYKKMLDEKKPNIVWAFVENNRHLEIVEACAPRKINVIFEKPLASTYKDAAKIRDLARKNGIQVMVNYQMAWWPANYTAKAEADAGAIGQVWRLRGIVGHGGPGSEGVRNKYFFEWLTDPVKNGAGALMDFGCYNALWSLWYLGRPESVYATANHLRPQTFPKVEDTSTMVLHYKNGVGMFEGSWDLPRSYQDLEVLGLKGSLYMQNGKVELRKGRETQNVAIEPLPANRSKPVAYMVDTLKSGKQIEGLTAMDINVDVIEIIDAAKESIRTGREVKLPTRMGTK